MINGSPNNKGCTNTALSIVAEILNEEGIEAGIERNFLILHTQCIYVLTKCFFFAILLTYIVYERR